MVIRKRIINDNPALVFITTTVAYWIPVFTIHEAAQAAIDQLRETIIEFNASLTGYVLMPSHLHLLLGLRRLNDLSRFVQTYKSLSSRRISELNLGRYRKLLQKNGRFRLWKTRFDDIIITSEEQFRIKLQYIHNNPVKAGLVADPEMWPYSSAGEWLTDKPGLIPVDKAYSWT